MGLCRGENSRFPASEVAHSVLTVRTHPADNRRPGRDGADLYSRLAFAAAGSLGLSATLVATAVGNDTALGAPRCWPWLLTGLQVLALWSAGTGRWWGWLLGGSVQLPWIAYAVVTSQLGFVPGCAISASVQIHSLLRNSARAPTPSTSRAIPEPTNSRQHR